jgi:hypothetical protein
MHLRSDDGLHRVTGRWIESKGTNMGGFRYAAWWIALPLFPVFYLLLIGWFDLLLSLAFAAGLAAMVGKFGADQVGGEYTVWSWVTLFRSELATLARHRQALLTAHLPRLRRRAQAPTRYRG